jgi:hypothetical protein
MFDSKFKLLTLSLLLAFAGALSAQDREFMRVVDGLAEPAAIDRADAINRIANWEGDIAANLRVAYRTAWPIERAGLLQAAALRRDVALVPLAAADLAAADDRVRLNARDYLLNLPVGDLKLDTAALTDAQAEAWDEFRNLRVRRDMLACLIDQWLKPGKFFGQFEDLRAHDAARLDTALVDLVLARTDVAEPLDLAAADRIAQGIEPHRLFSAAWRRLTEGQSALRAAEVYVRTGEHDRIGASISSSVMQTALAVVTELRATAAAALGQTRLDEVSLAQLEQFYQDLPRQSIEPRYRFALDPRLLTVELEIMLARHGLGEYLDARIARLHLQVERAREGQDSHVNLRASSRPDLSAMNEIAQLLLRRGDLVAAEQQLSAAIEQAQSDMMFVQARFRTTLVSYIGVAYYNLACAQALQLKTSASLENLKRAAANGYSDFAWMLEDGDLHHVRAVSEFDAWFAEVAPPSVYGDFAARRDGR